MRHSVFAFSALVGFISPAWAFPRWRSPLAERAVAAGVAIQANVILSSHSTLEELAEELFVDLHCLVEANPLRSLLKPGDLCYVPYHCCRKSCKGFCSKRPQCQGQSTATAPAQPTGTTTTCLTTITTSIPSPSPSIPTTSNSPSAAATGPSGSEAVTGQQPTTASDTPPNPTDGEGTLTTTDSLGQTVISDTSGAITIPSGISTATVVTLPGGSLVTFEPTASSAPPTTTADVVTTTNTLGQTVISDSSGAVTIPTGVSTASVVTLPGEFTVTFSPSVPPADTVSDAPAPETTSGEPTGGTTSADAPPGTSTGNLPPAVTTTNSDGVTVISDSSGAVTLPTGIETSSIFTLPGGSVITFNPSPSPTETTTVVPGPIVATTNSEGLTVISDTSGVVTLPTGLTTNTIITLPDGSVVSFTPSGAPTDSPITVLPPIVTTTNAEGLTIISDSSGAVTLPTGITTGSVITLPDGGIVTFPPEGSSPFPTSAPPTTTSDLPAGYIFPVTTSVPAPKATDDGTVIPCNLWFFNICISWLDLNIFGWEFNLPEGVRPPGPPPGITIPGLSISISGTLPPWPSLTIGPDRLPTYEPEPENCETQSAELCLTSTSFGVDTATITTTTTVLSTCATVYGCEVSDSATSTATTSTTSTTYAYSCTPGCDVCTGLARRDVPVATHAPSLDANLGLARRDIPNRPLQELPADFYNIITGTETNPNPNSFRVPLDNTPLTGDGFGGVSTSVYQAFDDKEKNVYVAGLTGCTSVAVVSRLGVWVSHFWEPSFVTGNFQAEVLDYLTNGRAEETGTLPLVELMQRGIFIDAATTKIFIMTPATLDRDLLKFIPASGAAPDRPATPEREQRDSLTVSDPQPLLDGQTAGFLDRLTPLRNALAEILPDVEISQFTYRRQQNHERIKMDAYGKMAILYSNNQKTTPDEEEDPLGPPQQALWQCWTQDSLIGSDQWDALPGQDAPCGTQDGNQKRQDGGVCSLSPSVTATTVSASPSTSQIVTTTSGSPVNPSDLPTLSCSVPKPTETGVFYLFTESYRACSEGGLCSDSLHFAGMATEDDWNAGCDFFTGDAADLFSGGFNGEDPYPPNVNFTLEETGAYCNTNPLMFELQCDGSWLVSGEGQGGQSHCTTTSLPATPTASCDEPTFTAEVTAVLACTGAICQPPP